MPASDERVRILSLWTPSGEASLEGARGAGAVIVEGARAQVPDGYVVVGSWLGLPHPGRPRLFVPLAPVEARRAAARLYQPQRLVARVAAAGMRGAMRVGAVAGRLSPLTVSVAVRSEEADRPAVLARWASKLGLEGEIAFAFLLGTPTPFRKDTAVALDERGRALARFKIGHGAAPGVRVRHEAEVLERLRGLHSGDVRIAQLLARFEEGDWAALALREEAGVAPEVDVALLRRMSRFIEALRQREPTRGAALGGELGVALQRRLRRLERGPARQAAARRAIGRAHVELAGALGGREMRLGWSHGDLAPWNILQGRGQETGAVVLDWEMACPGAPPLLDLFHLALYRPLQAQRLAPDGVLDHLDRCGARSVLLRDLSNSGASETDFVPLLRLYLADRVSRLLEDDLLGQDAKRSALIERMCGALDATR